MQQFHQYDQGSPRGTHRGMDEHCSITTLFLCFLLSPIPLLLSLSLSLFLSLSLPLLGCVHPIHRFDGVVLTGAWRLAVA